MILVLATNIFIYKFAVLQQGFVKELGLKLKGNNTKIQMADHYNPSLSFYADRVFKIANGAQKNALIFKKTSRNLDKNQSIILNKNGYVIIRNSSP